MRVLIKFTDAEGKEYVYPDIFSATMRYGGWRIPITDETTYKLAMVLDDYDENIFHIEELARQHNCKMEVIPVQNILGTYLSTLAGHYDTYKLGIDFVIKLYIILTPLILLLLSTYIISK